MSVDTLRTVVKNLRSEKVKERQQAFASLREVFGRDSAVDRLDVEGDGRPWLTIFQSIFQAVVLERTTYVKKGISMTSDVGRHRLEEAASTVRWLTERSVTKLNRRVIKPLLAHLLQTMVHQGQLLSPVALDYVKALRIVLSHQPHLDHLDVDQWMKLVSLAFFAILGEDLRKAFDEESEEEVINTSEEDRDTDDRYSTDEEHERPSKKQHKRDQDAPGKAKSSRFTRALSLEQIEFVAILVVLLHSPSAPFYNTKHPNLPKAILRGLQRLLLSIPLDSSAHLDLVIVLNVVLDRLALNSRKRTTEFGENVWDALLTLWGTKNKKLKEGLVITLTTLFPYVTHPESQFDAQDKLHKLYRLLTGDHESRWGVEMLSLDSLRLQLSHQEVTRAFAAKTFRFGFNFGETQALAWAIHELQADCLREMYLNIELGRSNAASGSRSPKKRARLQDPVTSLLHTIQTSTASNARAYHVQCLLFFIDRHWSTIHSELQESVIDLLVQYVAVDDAQVQSWIFLCFATIAASGNAGCDIPWETIWSHAMRRTNVANVCRAACHAAYVILVSRKVNMNQILPEIEAMAQDIAVQGPSAPFDSVCAFFVECIRVASQDVRLYKIQLEDKLLAWLTENWSISDRFSTSSSSRSRLGLEQRTVQDLLALLETICGLVPDGSLVCEMTLPDCAIVEFLQKHRNSAVVRDFLLSATLPTWSPSDDAKVAHQSTDPPSSTPEELVQASGRERKASASLLKTLESHLPMWETRSDAQLRPPAERLRRVLDLIVFAISFESSLECNGIRPNRRVLLAACKLLDSVSPYIKDISWSPEETELVLLGLSPLAALRVSERGETTWIPLVTPESETGIRKRGVSVKRTNSTSSSSRDSVTPRRLLRVIWQSSDVQDTFMNVLDVLDKLLRETLSGKTRRGSSTALAHFDEKDDFAPTRTETKRDAAHATEARNAGRHIVALCANFLVMSVALQSANDEPSKNKPLEDLLSEGDDPKFAVLAPALFEKVAEGHLGMSTSLLNKILDRFESIFMSYASSRSETFILLGVQFLMATTRIWIQPLVWTTDLGDHVRKLIDWLVKMHKSQKIRSWRIRDFLVRFYDYYLAVDPQQRFWLSEPTEDEEPQISPAELLPMLATDDDIRVRFSVGVAWVRLFGPGSVSEGDPKGLYDSIRGHLCLELENWEHMLTRFLTLANLMIVSSPVRRGPYWHILETCMHSQLFNAHVTSVLSNAACRMGFPSYRDMFQAFSVQIAYSVRAIGLDFYVLPPQLLGFSSRSECARMIFTSFSPINLLTEQQFPDRTKHGQNMFATHCKILNIGPADGLSRCFGDIVGNQIVAWMKENLHRSNEDHVAVAQELLTLLHQKFAALGGFDAFMALLSENIDRVVVAMLRHIEDTDFHTNGSIIAALQDQSDAERTVRAFRTLMKFRLDDDFEMHEVNTPSCPTTGLLRALQWLSTIDHSVHGAATLYHVLHQLFADIDRTALINEQLRLLHGLSVWIAVQHTHLKNATVLRVLSSNASILLSEPNLSTTAQGLLDIVFVHLREMQIDDAYIVDILMRICTVAQTFADGELKLRARGLQIMEWVEEQVLQLSEVQLLKRHLYSALAAWPRPLTGRLQQLLAGLTYDKLSSMLADEHITSHKFKLVRMIADVVRSAESSDPSTHYRFITHDFWRLKESIPVLDIPSSEVDSFNELLFLHAGQVSTLGSTRPSTRNMGVRHQELYSASSKRVLPSPKRPILMGLMDLLSHQDPHFVNIAYSTLRRIASIETLDSPGYGEWSSDYRGHVAFLNFCPVKEPVRPSQTLGRLVDNDFKDYGRDFKLWVGQFSVLLADVLTGEDHFFGHLSPVLENSTEFAQQSIPVLIHTLLRQEQLGSLSAKNSRAELSDYFTRLLSAEVTPVQCLRVVVETVLHLRHFMPENPSSALAYNTWLDVDFTLLSRCAIKCSSYTTALLFIELAPEYPNVKAQLIGDTSEQILFDIYQHIDEQDGFYGIKTQNFHQFLLRRFHHEKQWDKALRFHGAELEAEASNRSAGDGIVQSFHAFGFENLALATFQRMGAGDAHQSSSLNYDLGWRTESWDLPEITECADSSARLYSSLRAIHRERDSGRIDQTIQGALINELHSLHALGHENLAGIRNVCQTILCLAQANAWRRPDYQLELAAKSIECDRSPWSEFTEIPPNFDFADFERLMATRISLLRSVRRREQRDQIGNMSSDFTESLLRLEKACLLQLSVAARRANQHQIALNSVVRAQKLEKANSLPACEEFAHVLWAQQEQKQAFIFLKDCFEKHLAPHQKLQSIADKLHSGIVLAQLGEWAAEASLLKGTDIQTSYFDHAFVTLSQISCEETDVSTTRAQVCYKFGIFAQQQYHTIQRSPDILRLKLYSDRKRQELNAVEQSLRRTHSGTPKYLDLTSQKSKAQALYQQDTAQFQEVTSARDAYLNKAIEMFSLCLEAADTFDDDAAMRLCSLWLGNFLGTSVDAKISVAVDRVPSRKYVFLAHQLSARLSSGDESRLTVNQRCLQTLLIRMCSEHPFHSLYQVFALKSSSNSLSPPDPNRRTSMRLESPVDPGMDRAVGATELFNRLRAMPKIQDHLLDVERVCEAYLEWAKYQIKNRPDQKEKKRKDSAIPQHLRIKQIVNMKVPVTTYHTPVDPTLKYDDCVWIQGYDPHFSTAGGVNLPKICNCRGSDGRPYKQLFKGEGGDDLRQDAVMEQVFEVCNLVLSKDRETRRRELSIRTYKVIPLAPQAGLLEFVDSTMPLSGWLQTAHPHYNPDDIPGQKCASEMTSWQKRKIDKTELVTNFKNLLTKFRPVMRHFFPERQRDPLPWFQMRLKYARSVAVTSIIGHILGLGDRHTSNILIDKFTGEIVHIDLGIAFEQGKLLPTPERVPFRLTGDMVDGLGTSGPEGVFRRCAEETLRVLRDGSDVIKTILEVFKYDPLHQWTASAIKIQRAQGQSNQLALGVDGLGIGIDINSGGEDEAADRALSGVARKLDKSLSVEHTVNELISEAMDPNNLGLMYAGWSPYM